MTIREKMQRLRALQQLSQQALADRLDIGVSTVQAFEAGRDVHLEHARRIASYFCVSLDWLIDPARGWPPGESVTPRAMEIDRQLPANLTADEVVHIFAMGWGLWLEGRRRAEGAGSAPRKADPDGPARAVQ